MKKEQSYTGEISEIYPEIIDNLLKQHESKSTHVRTGVMKTLSILASILQENLEFHLP